MINPVTQWPRYVADGSTFDFAYTFKIFSKFDLLVYIDTTLAVVDTEYVVSGVGDTNGGMVTFVTDPGAASVISILPNVPLSQLSAYTTEPFPSARLEKDYDRVVMALQMLAERISRAILLKPSSQLVDQLLDEPIADLFLRAKSGGGYDWAGLGDVGQVSLPLSIPNGGTGAITDTQALSNLGFSTFFKGIISEPDASSLRVALGVSTRDDLFRIQQAANQAIELIFSLAALTADRIVTLPDRSGAVMLESTVASYNNTSNLGLGVGLAILSGASFALTLPAAALHTGREATIQHNGTSLTQVYTIRGNAADAIVAPDGTGNTYLLYTNGERVRIKSDGTSWYVLAHDAQTGWVDAGAITIGGTTTAPTKPTTPDYDHVFWRRSGRTVYVKFILQISSAAGSAAGSGVYLWTLPANISLDATDTPAVATPLAVTTFSEAAPSFVAGDGKMNIDSTVYENLTAFAYSTTQLQLEAGAGFAVGSANYPLTNAETGWQFEVHATAANWRL